MTPPVAERAELAAATLDGLRRKLSEAERNRFDIEMWEAQRHGGGQQLRKVLANWLVTVTVREHPDYEDQYKEFVTLYESGELFADTSLAESHTSDAL